jgi:iron complex transport system ATP-binding protein
VIAGLDSLRRLLGGRAPAEGDPTPHGSPPTTEPAIAVEDLSVSLGGTVALADVSLAVESGRFVGLVGPNGAGKTTLLRTVAGLLAPDAGTVRLHGEDVHALSSAAASRLLAVVPQETALAFDFDVREVVAMGRTPYVSRFGRGTRADGAAVERAMERTDVARFADRSIGAVSGGERQRVLLARALAQATPTLLLDEPTASLDVNHQVRTLDLLAELVTEGQTVVAAIHDLDLAARYCDELVLLAGGETLAAGTPSEVLTEGHLQRAFDAPVTVTRHPVTDSLSVTARPEGATGSVPSEPAPGAERP